jgi:signal transduction histidine kinase
MKKVIIYFILLIGLCGCVKVSKDEYHTESLPYKFEKIFKRNSPHNYFVTATSIYFNDSLSNFLAMTFNTQTEVPNDALKSYIIIYKGLNSFDQINFNRIKYPGIELVCPLPYFLDLNRNNIYEIPLLLQFRDSLVFGVFEMNDIPQKRWIRWKTIMREDGHYLTFLLKWKLPEKGDDIFVVRKSNRLRGRGYPCDTLIAYNASKEKFMIYEPVGPNFGNNFKFFLESTKLMLQSNRTENTLGYNGLNDFNRYNVILDTNGKFLIVDTLENEPLAYDIIEPTNSNYYYRYNIRNSRLEYLNEENLVQSSVPIKNVLTIDNYKISSNEDRVYVLTKDNTVISYSSELEYLAEVKPKVKIGSIHFWGIGNLNPLHDYYNMVTTLGSKEVDVNDNGTNDFLSFSKSDQIVIMDGETLEPIAAMRSKKENYSLSLVNLPTKEYCFMLNTYDEIAFYKIVPTPFLDRVHQWKLETGLLIVALLIFPISFYLIRRVRFYRGVYRILTNHNESHGIIVFRNNKIKYINDKVFHLLNINKKGFSITDLPQVIIYILHSNLKESDSQVESFVLDGADKKYLTIYGTTLSKLSNTKVIIINDSTNIVKREILSIAISIAHDAKNELAEVQARIENIIYSFRNNPEEISWLDSEENKLNHSLSSVVETLRKLLFASDYFSKEKKILRLTDVMKRWIESNGSRYERSDINFVNNTVHSNTVLLDEHQFQILLQCACDNAKQAMSGDKEKIIEFSTEMVDNGIKFSIKDNGVGISEKVLTQILDKNYSSKSIGSSLGLKIIKKVCDEQNAKFEIESKPNKGTNINIIFSIINET